MGKIKIIKELIYKWLKKKRLITESS